MKKLNKLSLSLVVGSLLFTQSYALPSGGGVSSLMEQVEV